MSGVVVCGNTTTACWVTGGAKAVTLIGFREAWPTPDAVSSLTVDAGCQVALGPSLCATPMRLAPGAVAAMGWGQAW